MTITWWKCFNDVKEDFIGQPEQFTELLDDANKPLYPRCKKFTKMSALVRLYKLKVGNGWSDKSFTATWIDEGVASRAE